MKHMKKIAAVLMVTILMSLALTGCGAQNKEMAGKWTCTSLDMGTGNVLEQLGSAYAESILFYALDDETCLLDMAGQQIPMHYAWVKDNKDYKLTITLADFAEANGMTEEQMKNALQGSSGENVDTEQNYRAEMKDGKLVLDMAAFYDDVHKQDDSSADEFSYKMEFTFERTGDAPASLDEVKNMPVIPGNTADTAADNADTTEAPADTANE